MLHVSLDYGLKFLGDRSSRSKITNKADSELLWTGRRRNIFPTALAFLNDPTYDFASEDEVGRRRPSEAELLDLFAGILDIVFNVSRRASIETQGTMLL